MKPLDPWPRLYLNAILEHDPRKQPKRIRQAERAILKRLNGVDFIIRSEEQLIAGAMSRLAELKKARGSPLKIRYLDDRQARRDRRVPQETP